jgi:hypothetical protein
MIEDISVQIWLSNFCIMYFFANHSLCKSFSAYIKVTSAMKNSNCLVNNPKGTCCYPDVYVYNKYKKI